jgi:hypothetical protein
MRNSRLSLGPSQSALNLLQHIQVILNILVTRILRKFRQKRVNFILWVAHLPSTAMTQGCSVSPEKSELFNSIRRITPLRAAEQVLLGGAHPPCGPALLESGGGKIDLWYSPLKVVEVQFADEAAFRNINTREELAASGGD